MVSTPENLSLSNVTSSSAPRALYPAATTIRAYELPAATGGVVWKVPSDPFVACAAIRSLPSVAAPHSSMVTPG